MFKRIFKFFYYLLVSLICSFRKAGIWTFPKGIRLTSGKFVQNMATSVAGQLAREAKNKRYTQSAGELMKNPFLRFHANYSLTHVDLNTPCTRSLAVDLASVTELSDKKILCLGSRNLDEIFQLQLAGARLENITAVDLYSEFPEIIPMDFQDLKFEDGSFDVIFWAGSYAYASDPMLALSEAFRVLRSPGIFALGDTYLGEATKSSYNANQSIYMKENSELNSALDELPEGTTLTKGLSGLEEIQERVKSFGVEKIVLSRDYVTTPHYNLIATMNKKIPN
jgi:SAM-dependent methyltransferase